PSVAAQTQLPRTNKAPSKPAKNPAPNQPKVPTGSYALFIPALSPSFESGTENYRLTLPNEVTAPNPRNLKRTERNALAQRYAEEAEQLRLSGTADALRASLAKYGEALNLWRAAN